MRAVCELADALAVERVNEVGDEYAAFARLQAHRQLVAEVARRRVAHAGQAQVLAQGCGGLNVEVVERHDAINLARAREVADGARERVEREVGGHVEEFVNRLARPVGVPKLCARDEHDAAALSLARAHELLPLLVARDAQDCERALIGQGELSRRFWRSATAETRTNDNASHGKLAGFIQKFQVPSFKLKVEVEKRSASPATDSGWRFNFELETWNLELHLLA